MFKGKRNILMGETEVESLCKAFPNAKIFISEDKVQNIDIKEE